MKKPDLLVALTRVRVFAILAGLAWLFGVAPPPGMRIALVVLVLAAITADGWLDHQRPGHTAKAPPVHDRYQTTA